MILGKGGALETELLTAETKSPGSGLVADKLCGALVPHTTVQ